MDFKPTEERKLRPKSSPTPVSGKGTPLSEEEEGSTYMMGIGSGTTIIVRPQGLTLDWDINGYAPVNNADPDVPSFAHQRVRSFQADVEIAGYLIVGVACMQVRAQLTSGLLLATLETDQTITWSLAGVSYAKPGPTYATTYWPFDLLADLDIGQVLEALVRYGPLGGRSAPTWAPAQVVTVELD